MKKYFTFLALLFVSGLIQAQSFTWNKIIDVEYPTGIVFDNRDTMWYIIQGTGLFEKSNSTSIDHSSGLVTDNVISIAYDSPLIWAGGYGGLSSFDGTSYNTYDDGSGLNGYALYDIDAKNGKLWIAMESEGASYFDGTAWTHYTSSDGLLGGWFTSVKTNSNGVAYVASNETDKMFGFVNIFDGTSWSVLDTNNGLRIHYIMSLLVDNQDNLWIGGKGLIKYDGTNLTTIIPDTLSQEIISMIEDDDGNIWFEKRNDDVYMYDGTHITSAGAPEHLSGKPQGLAKNAQGNIYTCLKTGIYQVTVQTTTEIIDCNELKISLYPNPASHFVSINLKNNQQDNISIDIVDAKGQLIKQVSKLNSDMKVDVSNLSRGVYFVKIYSNDSISLKKLLIE